MEPRSFSSFAMRAVSALDLTAICRHRHEMFKDSGYDDQLLTVMAEPFRLWLEPRLADGRYSGWFAMSGDEIAGGIGMIEIDWPPGPSHPISSRRSYILNLYVEPPFRRRGLGGLLMSQAIEESIHLGMDYSILHATDQGRPLYERLGWTQTNEMGRKLCRLPSATGNKKD